jgi:hypothetical protein
VKLRGAGRIGPHPLFGYRATWPVASLVIAPDYLEMSLWPVMYRFDRSSIVALTRKRILWSTYLRIVHRNPRYERWVLFIPPGGLQRLEGPLSQYGYRVEDASVVSEPTDVTFSSGITTAAWVGFALAIAAGLVGVVVAFYATSR